MYVDWPITPSPHVEKSLTGAFGIGIAVTVQWESSVDDAAAQQALLSGCNAVRDTANSNGVFLPFLFMNDANYAQDVLSSYGAASKTQLKAVAKKYDPQGLFQTQQNNGFLLSKSP